MSYSATRQFRAFSFFSRKLYDQHGQFLWAMFFISALLLSGCGGTAIADESNKEQLKRQILEAGAPDRCKGRQIKTYKDRMDCQYPSPPIGRWKAVYSKEFAQAHNLPAENVSTDLSPGVDYAEMEVVPYGKGGIACLVGMLIKKPHDLSLDDGEKQYSPLPRNKKFLRLIKLSKSASSFKPLITVHTGSRDFKVNKRGYRMSSAAEYLEDALPGYDYLSANANCTDISRHADSYFPKGYAFWVRKASIWGRYESRFENMNSPGYPSEDRQFGASFLSIDIPEELVSAIFENVSVGGVE